MTPAPTAVLTPEEQRSLKAYLVELDLGIQIVATLGVTKGLAWDAAEGKPIPEAYAARIRNGLAARREKL